MEFDRKRGVFAARVGMVHLLGLLLCALTCLRAAAADAPGFAATNMAQVIALPALRAAEQRPARISGVVTFHLPGSRSLFLRDGDRSMYAELADLPEPLSVGWSVELTGRTREGVPQNFLTRCTVRMIAQGQTPEPARVTAAMIQDGSAAAQFVEVRGRARSLTHEGDQVNFVLRIERSDFPVHIGNFSHSARSLNRLVDADVRLRGVVRMPRVPPGEPLAPVLEVAALDDLEVLEAGVDPFSRPVWTVAAISKAAAENNLPSTHALRVSGTILSIHGTSVELEDPTGRITLECVYLPTTLPGQRADAVGYPAGAGDIPKLAGAHLRLMAPRPNLKEGAALKFPEDYLPVITRVEPILQLVGNEAAVGYPVRLVAAVTFVDPIHNFLFVQDPTGGVFVQSDESLRPIRLFDLVEIEGVTGEGDYTPIVTQAKIRKVGQGAPPRTGVRFIGDLVSGREDSQWVTLEAVVRQMTRAENAYELVLGSGGQRFFGWIPYEDGEPDLASLVDAEILVSAVCGTTLNEHEQSLAVNLFIPGRAQIRILRAAPRLAGIAPSHIANTRRFDLNIQPGHRMRFVGRVVLGRRSGELVVHDGTGFLQVSGPALKTWPVDTAVEVLGFPRDRGLMFGVDDAVVIAVRDGMEAPPPVRPRVVPEEEWRGPDAASLELRIQGTLIRTEATLLERHRTGEDMVFTCEAGGRLIAGLMEGGAAQIEGLRPRSEVRLTGLGERGGSSGSGEPLTRLLLRGPGDLEVLRGPPWWSRRWAIWLMGGLAMAIAAAGGAALSLRKQVISKDLDLAKNVQRQALLEQRFQELVENANDMIFTFDPEGRLLSLNRAGEECTGYAVAEIASLTVDDLTQDPASEAYAEWRSAWMRGAGPTRCEWVIKRKDGSNRTLEVTTSPQKHGDMAVAVQGIARDIGERLRLEAELRHAQKMETIGQLAGGVAHDFNNILTIIHGYNRLARMRVGNDPDLIDSLMEVERAADRAAALTRQLLTFGRKQAMLRKVTNLNDLILQTSKMLHRLIGETIELHLSCAPDLPLVWVDQGMMEQVLMNLVVNARDAMPKGGRLDIRTERFERLTPKPGGSGEHLASGRLVCVEVKDSGTGMSDQVRAHVFEPFFTTKPVGQGTGLGLATVYGIVKQHGGWMEVETELGRGSVFRLLLPVTDKTSETAGPSLDPIPPERGHETILLVEDEPSLRALGERVLGRCGYRVITAPDGPEALRVARGFVGRIDLLLTDLVMPGGVSGVELARQLGGDRPSMRVLFTSGYGREVAGDSPLIEGVNFIAKPYQAARLIHVVRQTIDGLPALPGPKA